MQVNFKKELETAKLPTYATQGAAGADVYSAKEYILRANSSMMLETGLLCSIPEGYEIQVRPRSGLALKNKITVLNSPGTIDSDYTGPLNVILVNFSHKDFLINVGDRIAQVVVAPVTKAEFGWVDSIQETDRGSAGFGSTGV